MKSSFVNSPEDENDIPDRFVLFAYFVFYHWVLSYIEKYKLIYRLILIIVINIKTKLIDWIGAMGKQKF